MNPLEWNYAASPEEQAAFGDVWCGPDSFPYGGWTVIARYAKKIEDGQPVEIDIMALPARSYRIRALASMDSCGEPLPAWTLSTGCGDGIRDLCISLAKAATEGMIGADALGDLP